jgi:lipoprotein-anchoring transpeptidase ErfK/SrfK
MRSLRRLFLLVLTISMLFSVFLFNQKAIGGQYYQFRDFSFTIQDIGDNPNIWNLFADDWYVVSRINRMTPGSLSGRIKIPEDMERAKRYTPFPLNISNKEGKLVFINLANQALAVYKKGVLVEWMPVSTGGNESKTPTGEFFITKKFPHYYSKTYPKPNGGASMPFALQLNYPYSGYFIHAGALPGKPSSKGCIRLMRRDAEDLYRWAKKGTKVLIK